MSEDERVIINNLAVLWCDQHGVDLKNIEIEKRVKK